MYCTTKGLVLRETDYKDTDRLLTVLTKDHGLMTLKARGVRSRSSRLKGACQLFAYSEFTYFEYRGFATVNEAELLESFSALRSNLEKLALASYFVQVAETVSQEEVISDALLSLTLNALYALSRLSRPLPLIKAVFEVRIACYAGYTPELDSCPICGNDTPDCFNVTLGVLQCASCSREGYGGLRLPLRPGTLAAMRFIRSQPANRIFSFTVSDAVLNELSGLAETYLLTRFERSFSALDFLKSLMIPLQQG